MQQQLEQQRKAMKQQRKAGVPIATASYTAFGWVMPGMTKDMLPEGVPSNFSVKQEATLEFHSHRPMSLQTGKLGNMKGEAKYREYYIGILQQKDIWMNFFQHPENIQHCEHTCGILGTLATTYRQRGDYENCGRVLDLEDEILELYREHTRSDGVPAAARHCYDGLNYKCLMIRYNMNMGLRNYDENIPIFGRQADYELRYNLGFEQQEYLFLVEAVLGKKNPTAKYLKRLSDTDIKSMIMAPVKMGQQGIDSKEKQRVALNTCGNCGIEEKALRQFPGCSGCKKVHYCGKDCQKAHWKVHKKECHVKK